MTPQQLLVLVSIIIILLNVLTVRYREGKLRRLEQRLRGVAERAGGELTLEEISQGLGIPIYDARILVRKFVSKGKMEMRRRDGRTAYVFKG